jgi:hypothetical protein
MVRDDRWYYVERGKKIHPSYRMDTKELDAPSKAKCIICDKIISYGARGWVSLIEHSNSNEHAEKLKLKDSNYTLGVSKE